MLLLASGRVIDLSTDRAKHHALKLRGPAADAEHRALYALVDVIYRFRNESGEPRHGWTEYDFAYSGYTLADIHQAPDWSEGEKAELYHWITQDTQKLRIETARRRLVENQPQLSTRTYPASRHLFSLLRKRIESLPLQRASTVQWNGTINNLQQNGIRKEEIIWSGLQRFLSQQARDSVLNRQQILEAINFSNISLQLSTEQIWGDNGGVNFREVALRMPHQAVYRAALKLDDSCHCILRYIDDTYNYRVGVVKTLSHKHHMSLNKCWFALDPYGRAVINPENKLPYFSNSKAAIAMADRHARDYPGFRSGVRFHTHYDHLTLYGGHDYREWMVSLPDYQRTFYGAHHFDHNILLHIRTTVRHDHNGRKLLFIEEIQSDWHQRGHMDGYDTSYWGKVANAPFKKEWPSLGIKLMLIHASQNGFDGISWPGGDIQETRYTRSLQAIRRHYDVEIPRSLNRLGTSFNCRVEQTEIATRDPWLNLVKSNNKWRVSDGRGKFQTRDKYYTREEAMMVLHRHCKSIDLPVSMFLINDDLRRHIAVQGLPLFGETVD